MKLERVRPAVFRLTLHAYELASLMAAARTVAEEGEDRLPREAAEQLRRVLDSYDAAVRGVDARG